jgi:hypothetical protein
MGIFRLAHSKYTAIPRSEATPTVVKLAVARSSDVDRVRKCVQTIHQPVAIDDNRFRIHV